MTSREQPTNETKPCLNCGRQKSDHYLDGDDPALCHTEGDKRFNAAEWWENLPAKDERRGNKGWSVPELLESYSSHVNAALREKLASAELSLKLVRADRDKQWQRAEAAESRISELERERDEARPFRLAYELNLVELENTRKQLSTTQEALDKSLNLLHEMWTELISHRYIEAGGSMPTDGSKDTRWMKEVEKLLAERVLSPPTKLP